MSEQVTVQDMMVCRERRAMKQEELLGKYNVPLVSFCLNIPGPVKTDADILRAFEAGKRAVLLKLEENHINILETDEVHEKTGDELMLAVESDAEKLKSLMVEIENSHQLGRLFDLDVINTDGSKLSRSSYRTCLICGRQAQDCARSRRHTVDELFAKVKEIIAAYQ